MAGLYLGGKVVAPVVTKEIPEEKFGLTISNFIGDVDENGKLQGATFFNDIDIVMNGVTQVNNTLNFAYTNGPRSISFPDMTIISNSLNSSFSNAFYGNSYIKIIDFSSLTEIVTPRSTVFFNMCENATHIDLVDFRNLQKVDGGSNIFAGMFRGGTVASLNFDSLEYINGPHFYDFCYDARGLTNLSFPKLKRIYNTTGINGNGNYRAFYYCIPLVNINMSALESVDGYFLCGNWFQGCSNLESVNLNSLTTISGQNACREMFRGCTSLPSIDLGNLTTISGQNACYGMFYSCTSLTSIDLSNLTTISGNSACYAMFYGCNKLTTILFPSLTTIEGTNPFGNSGSSLMFYNCTGLTEIHFRADAQATIEAIPGYSSKFGATNATIYFDL